MLLAVKKIFQAKNLQRGSGTLVEDHDEVIGVTIPNRCRRSTHGRKNDLESSLGRKGGGEPDSIGFRLLRGILGVFHAEKRPDRLRRLDLLIHEEARNGQASNCILLPIIEVVLHILCKTLALEEEETLIGGQDEEFREVRHDVRER